MWSRWSCCSGGSFLRQRVSFVFSGSHVCVGKVYLFDPLRGFGGECGGRRGGVAFVWKQMKRGVCSTNSVSYPAGGVSSGSCGSGNGNGNGNGNDNNNCNNNNNNINNKSKSNNDDEDIGNGTKGSISFHEAKRLMRLANVESLKIKLMRLADGKETIPYSDLLAECEKMGVARNAEEATAFAQCLDDAGVVLLFRDKVYLHPDKVVDLVRKVIPLELTAEDDPMKEELKKLQKAKNEIDMLAHIQVRKILWSGLGVGVFTVGLFFRLTFWEYSWDVMEPITYFTTSTGLVVGYAYFLFTSRDPTYQDFMKRLFFSRQRILHKNYNFDVKRFNELQCKYQNPINASAILRNRQGVELDFEDALRKD